MTRVTPTIPRDIFVEILQDKNLVQPDDLLIFQTIYSLDKQEASATDLARILGWTDKGAVVGRLVGLGKRILKKHDNANPISIQRAYLFAWNPANWHQWTDPKNVPYIEDNIEELKTRLNQIRLF
jgi:5-methylcytosine-specific restriction enzyme A